MKLLDDYFFGFSWSRKTIFFEETVEAEFCLLSDSGTHLQRG